MEYMIGAMIPVLLAFTYYTGYKRGVKYRVVEKADEQTERAEKKFHEDFQAIMNYDVQTAMQRKKV